MKLKLPIGSLVILLFFTSKTCARGVNGGMSCAVCTVLAGVAMQVSEIHEESFFNTTRRLCAYLPSFAAEECVQTVSKIEPYFVDISEEFTPDLFCLSFGTCKVGDDQQFCHLFPLPFENKLPKNILQQQPKQIEGLPRIDVCKLPFIMDICNILNSSYISLNAAEDLDRDGFSLISVARGSDWRGKDCNDANAQVYPGRRPIWSDFQIDSNCNGIYGIDNKTHKSWEQLLCKKSEPRGLIFIGDSIGAHFSMPEVWINPTIFDWPVDFNGTNLLLDEIDWPQFGFATGYKKIPPNNFIKGAVDSIYLRLRSRNRCNHRDYQNLSQNGASSNEGVYHANSTARNQTADHPALVIYAMQGNDVCNNFNDTLNHVTNPVVFKKNIMKSLFLLDEKLPANSHVVLVELVNADFVYEPMAKRLHPLGQLHRNIYYDNLYDWYNCMQIGPCNGWLNANKTLRTLLTQKSDLLNSVIREIVQNEKFKYFDLHFVENPINVLVAKNKVDIPSLLESVDSLHPNQNAQPLLADTLWELLMNLPPQVLGPVNPNNNMIIKLFGNQGGH